MSEPSDLNSAEILLKKATEAVAAVKHIFSKNITEDASPPSGPNAVYGGFVADIFSQFTRTPQDFEMGLEILKTQLNDGLTDDKKYLMEDIVDFASKLPSDSSLKDKVTGQFVKQLWGNLSHPPQTLLGDNYRYRTADGSNNNILYPNLGKAGSCYARTLPPRRQLTPNLPDPGLIFDEIFARSEGFKKHPTRISSMLFYLASIIIHDCFRTNSENENVVDSSSYLDLSPLYGHNEKEQDIVRNKQGGLGKLWPDVFSEPRLLGFPPGVCALLVCFNRFHNYIAGELLEINEGGRFTLNKRMQQSDALAKRDEDLFQTARLVTCGLYVNIVLIDYVRVILNLNRTNSDWNLDPRVDLTAIGPDPLPQGVGNQVSVEFNLVYRWHSAISKRDEQWSIDFFRMILGGADPNLFSEEELGKKFRQFLGNLQRDGPKSWVFGGIQRTADGSFETQDLVKIITASTEDIAGAFGPRNVPICMKAIEVLGIQQSRRWNVATLNEFRNYFGLASHKTFQDITTNEEVALALEAFYGHPDDVEMYVGCVAEDAKEARAPGSGICLGYTLSRTILADATALVRGDRFYTSDYTAAALTNWGYNQVASNPRVAGGGVIYKLLMKAFPGYYKGNSVYAMFPFNIPEENRVILHNLEQGHLYDYNPPRFLPKPKVVTTYDAARRVLGDQERFKVPWGPNTTYITHQNYMLSGDSQANTTQRNFVRDALQRPTNGLQDIAMKYEIVTEECLRSSSRKLTSGYIVDAVADVGNISHAICAADMYHIPVKTRAHPIAPFTANEIYTAFSVLFAFVFLDLDESTDFVLHYYARLASKPLKTVIKAVVQTVQWKDYTGISRLWGWFRHENSMEKSYGTNLILRLSEGGKSADEVTETIIPSIAAMVATQAQGFAQMLDLFLQPKYYKKHWHIIEQLSRSDDPYDFEKLKKYALEGYRLATASFGLIRNVDANSVHIQDGENIVHANKGDRVFTNFVTAGVDPKIWTDPYEIDIHRDESLYIHHGYGAHECLGKFITNHAMASQLKVFGKLKNLRRAPGDQGILKYKLIDGAVRLYMTPDWSDYSPFPTTLKVMFDDFSPQMRPKESTQGGNGVNEVHYMERHGIR